MTGINQEPALRRLNLALLSEVRTDKRDMTLRQLAALVSLATEGPQTVRGLAALLNTPRGAITRAGDTLEARGLARRQPEIGDKRGCVLAITAAGRKHVARLETALS